MSNAIILPIPFPDPPLSINSLIKSASRPIVPQATRRRLRMMLDLVGLNNRRRLVFQLGINAGLGVMEVLSIVSVFPFLAVAAHPEFIWSNEYLNTAYKTMGFTGERRFLLFLGFVLLGMMIATNAATILVRTINTRFIENLTHELSAALARNYLRQPYPFFLGMHTSTIYARLAGDVQAVGQNVFRPAFEVCAKSISAGLICLTLFLVNPIAALVVVALLMGGYVVIYHVIKSRLTRLGAQMRESNRLKTKRMHECFSGIKVAKVMGLEEHLLRRFEHYSAIVAREKVSQSLYQTIPVHIMEIFVFVLVVAGTLYVVSTFENFAEAVPVLGLYAFGAYRVKPGFQSIYASFASIQVGLPRVEAVYEHMQLRGPAQPAPETILATDESTEAVDAGERPIIEFRDVVFRYESAERPTLVGINMAIARNTTVGIRGVTGSGKTTMLDLIMGLLVPTDGTILIDGRPMCTEQSVRAWQRRVGYVPQDIYLTDGTVAENIAFGLEADTIDMDAVKRAARMAQIADFVESQLPNGYDTTVGERGVRLSGGQRQRIGIARALYYNPDVLVFDEATSALDNETEAALMQSVHALSHQLTIIMVAHRLSTLEGCDEIVKLEDGRVAEAALAARTP